MWYQNGDHLTFSFHIIYLEYYNHGVADTHAVILLGMRCRA